MEKLLDWFEEHKVGIIGSLALHSLFLLVFTMWQLRGTPTEEERSTMQLDVIEIDQAEQMIEQLEDPQRTEAREVKNLTSNITATKSYQPYSSQRLSERVEEDLRKFEQEEFDRLAQERRDRGEEIEMPQLDPSKWNKELYMDKAAEPMKVEGATTVWHDLQGRVRENDVPGYLCKTEGRVAVRVTVSADGTVTKADVDRSRSANADDCMLEHALRSTRRARFSSGAANQSGTVFFLFLRQ